MKAGASKNYKRIIPKAKNKTIAILNSMIEKKSHEIFKNKSFMEAINLTFGDKLTKFDPYG